MSSEYPDSRVFFNILGGSLTLLSVQMPWLVINAVLPVSVQSSGLYAVAYYWILAGAILSFLSRLGGVMTLVGMLAFLGNPYSSFGPATAGLGGLVAFFGAILTFAGARWSIPRTLVKGREILGGVLYSVGFLIVLTLIVGMFVYGNFLIAGSGQVVVEMPLFIVGVLLTGLGLRLFLKPERRETSLSLLTSTA